MASEAREASNEPLTKRNRATSVVYDEILSPLHPPVDTTPQPCSLTEE